MRLIVSVRVQKHDGRKAQLRKQRLRRTAYRLQKTAKSRAFHVLRSSTRESMSFIQGLDIHTHMTILLPCFPHHMYSPCTCTQVLYTIIWIIITDTAKEKVHWTLVSYFNHQSFSFSALLQNNNTHPSEGESACMPLQKKCTIDHIETPQHMNIVLYAVATDSVNQWLWESIVFSTNWVIAFCFSLRHYFW